MKYEITARGTCGHLDHSSSISGNRESSISDHKFCLRSERSGHVGHYAVPQPRVLLVSLLWRRLGGKLISPPLIGHFQVLNSVLHDVASFGRFLTLIEVELCNLIHGPGKKL